MLLTNNVLLLYIKIIKCILYRHLKGENVKRISQRCMGFSYSTLKCIQITITRTIQSK